MKAETLTSPVATVMVVMAEQNFRQLAHSQKIRDWAKDHPAMTSDDIADFLDGVANDDAWYPINLDCVGYLLERYARYHRRHIQ
ncbi:MAG TPA: hypothetical protein VMT81_02795 [Candidatus Paceibacterota bacterium]|nr:hypothetical protein [Candidatus Paceibacterota bacterium]